MLRWRLLLGTLIIAGLVGLFWLDTRISPPGLVLFLLAIVVAALAAGEMLRLLGRVPAPRATVVYVGTLLVVGSGGVPMFWPGYPSDCPVGRLGWPLFALALCLLLAFVSEMAAYRQPGGVITRLAKTMFAIVYVGLLLAFAVALRGVGDGLEGVGALVSLIVVVKMSDIGAYTVGRLVGRHKLAPVLSPGKTWEGVAGGIVFACLASLIVFHLLTPDDAIEIQSITVGGPLIFGLFISIAGLLGDLAESLVKREAGLKDSSQWMPGFGGVLDLLDSILAASPVAYACWVLGLV